MYGSFPDAEPPFWGGKVTKKNSTKYVRSNETICSGHVLEDFPGLEESSQQYLNNHQNHSNSQVTPPNKKPTSNIESLMWKIIFLTPKQI